MRPIKILGLMLASNNCEALNKCYRDMVDICRQTWIKYAYSDTKIFCVYGRDLNNKALFDSNNTNIVIDSNNIIVNSPERRDNLLYKTIKAMEYCLHSYPDYDYFFRPNCGSYVNTRLLHNFLTDKPTSQYYSAINGIHNNIKFASGSCILMSRDVVQFLVDHQNELEYNGNILMDDVAIGKLLLDNKFILHNDAMRVDCHNESQLMSNFNANCYHYYFCHTINPQLINLCHQLTLESNLI